MRRRRVTLGAGGAQGPRYLGDGAGAAPQPAARVDRNDQDDDAADPDGKWVVLVLDHHERDAEKQPLDEDTQVAQN